MYIAVVDFVDLQDERYLYKAGDKFPRDGAEVSNERVAELSSTLNKSGKVLIKAIEEPKRKKTTKKKKEK